MCRLGALQYPLFHAKMIILWLLLLRVCYYCGLSPSRRNSPSIYSHFNVDDGLHYQMYLDFYFIFIYFWWSADLQIYYALKYDLRRILGPLLLSTTTTTLFPTTLIIPRSEAVYVLVFRIFRISILTICRYVLVVGCIFKAVAACTPLYITWWIRYKMNHKPELNSKTVRFPPPSNSLFDPLFLEV